MIHHYSAFNVPRSTFNVPPYPLLSSIASSRLCVRPSSILSPSCIRYHPRPSVATIPPSLSLQRFTFPHPLAPDPCSHEKAPQRTYPQTRLKWRKTPTVNQLLGRAAGLLSGICLFLAAARLLAFVFTRRATGRSTGRFLWSGLRTTTTTTSGSSRSSKNHKYGNE